MSYTHDATGYTHIFHCKICKTVIGGGVDLDDSVLNAARNMRDAFCHKCNAEGRIIKIRKVSVN